MRLQRLLSISYDDTIRIWGPTTAGASAGGKGGAGKVAGSTGDAAAESLPSGFQQLISIKHNNQTGRCVEKTPCCVVCRKGRLSIFYWLAMYH